MKSLLMDSVGPSEQTVSPLSVATEEMSVVFENEKTTVYRIDWRTVLKVPSDCGRFETEVANLQKYAYDAVRRHNQVVSFVPEIDPAGFQQFGCGIIMPDHGEDLYELISRGLDDHAKQAITEQVIAIWKNKLSGKVIHGDIKPDNFMWNGTTLTLVDWDTAVDINDEDGMEAIEHLGTKNFWDPCKFKGSSDLKTCLVNSDKFGLAATIFMVNAPLHLINRFVQYGRFNESFRTYIQGWVQQGILEDANKVTNMIDAAEKASEEAAAAQDDAAAAAAADDDLFVGGSRYRYILLRNRTNE